MNNHPDVLHIAERHRRIESFIAAHTQTEPGLRELQSEIEALRAMANSPELALGCILDLLSIHLTSLVVVVKLYAARGETDLSDLPSLDELIPELRQITYGIKAAVGQLGEQHASSSPN